MATYTISLNAGNNLISIPLDMTGVSYEDDPRTLFNSSLRNHDDSKYLYKFIKFQGQIIANVDGMWSGNYTQIQPQHAFWIWTADSHEITFNGANLNPVTLEYTLNGGWNLLSYPYQIENHFGEGEYDNPTKPYTIRKDYLKGSGHEKETVKRVLGQGQMVTYLDNTDPNYQPTEVDAYKNWTGNLTKFEPGKGIGFIVLKVLQ